MRGSSPSHSILPAVTDVPTSALVARTYTLVSLLPHSLVDACLAVQDRLYGFYLSHVRRALQLRLLRRGGDAQRTGGTGPGAGVGAGARPPLPDVPQALRPGQREGGAPSHVGLGHGHGHGSAAATPSTAPASTASGSGGEDDAQSESSLEDFGPLGASTMSGGGGDEGRAQGQGQGMDGSFVHV